MILVIGGAYQGKYDFVKNILGIEADRILNGFHITVKNCLKEGKSIEDILNYVYNEGYQVVISDEIGCGIVPLDIEDRQWREITGRCLCALAKKSSRVYRVHCGIATILK